MEAPRPPADDQPGTDAATEALFALAAGELEALEAAALRARLAGSRDLRADYEDIEGLEHRLRAEPLLPLPPFLVRRILAASTHDAGSPALREPARVRPHMLLARVAACALIAFAAWLAFSGEMPALPDASAPARLVAALPAALPATLPADAFGDALPLSLRTDAGSVLMDPLPNSASPSLVGTLMLSVVGLLLLVLGLGYARVSHRAAGDLTSKGGQG